MSWDSVYNMANEQLDYAKNILRPNVEMAEDGGTCLLIRHH